jgi:serine acetyltransferase
MGSIINPGVTLGDFTTVSAGSVVNDNFPNGYCVIAGDPAVILIDYSGNDSIKEKFIRYRNVNEYNGYIPYNKFEKFRKAKLTI